MQPHRPTKPKQSGFSVLEALIIILVIAVLAGTSYVAYQRLKNVRAKNSASTSQSQATPPLAQTTTQYFTIKEWGVRAPYAGSLKLSYTISSEGKSARFSSDQLTILSSDCMGRGGWIERWASTDKVSEGPPDANTPTAEQAFAGKDPAAVPYAHIGNYYYTFHHDQAACGDLNTTAALQSQTNDAVKALVPNLQAIPNTQTATQYLDIKEWGIKVKLDDADKITYVMHGTPFGPPDADAISSYASLRLNDTVNTSDKCKDLGMSIVQQTAATNATKVANYSYGFWGGESDCGDSTVDLLRAKITGTELVLSAISAE